MRRKKVFAVFVLFNSISLLIASIGAAHREPLLEALIVGYSTSLFTFVFLCIQIWALKVLFS